MTPLRQRMLQDMQIRNFFENTRKCYLQQASLFARHFRRSPEGLGPANIRDYQLYQREEARACLDFDCHHSVAHSVFRDDEAALGRRGSSADAEEAREAAGHPESGRGPALFELRSPTQGAHRPHGLLRRRIAHLRSDCAQAHRHR